MHGCGGSVVLVEPFGAGGGVDVIASSLAAQLTQIWAVPVTVDNRPGLGATAAPAFVAAAAADGRTLLINTSAHAYSAAFATGLPYDPLADFVAIAPVTSQPYVLVATERSGIRSLDDLIRAAQARPLTFASSGVGTGTHLSVAELNLGLGISATHLPARPTDVGAATIERVAAGEADYAMCPISMAQSHLRDGTVTALGVSCARRSQLLPDVPTLQEAGAADFDFPIWVQIPWRDVERQTQRVEVCWKSAGFGWCWWRWPAVVRQRLWCPGRLLPALLGCGRGETRSGKAVRLGRSR